MKRSVQTSSFVRAALGGTVLGLTLVVGVSQSAFAQQQASSTTVSDAAPGSGISANAGPGAAPAAQPPTRTIVVSPYTAPSMGGSDVPSNHRGSHGDGNSNS